MGSHCSSQGRSSLFFTMLSSRGFGMDRLFGDSVLGACRRKECATKKQAVDRSCGAFGHCADGGIHQVSLSHFDFILGLITDIEQ